MPEVPAPYRLLHLAETGSTNDDCLAYAQAGEPEGLVIAADAQVKGRGRQGRSWHTQAGSALAFTVLLRPSKDEQAYTGRFTALGGLALVQALREGYGIRAQVKWPNDVLINGRKTCGILAETVWQGERAEAVALGMGINILAGAVPKEARLVYPATSIETETGQKIGRWELLGALLEALSALRVSLPTGAFMEAWNKDLAFRGQRAAVREDDGRMRDYVVLGVGDDAGLRVLDEEGQEKVIYSAELKAREG